ncbi:MAG: HAMP domain-containing protein [Xanthomonadales bacterium]|nr:HAMP domain-containing protein [Xanthomonadales bacterium]
MSQTTNKSDNEGGSSLIIRFATATVLLAIAVVLLAIIFFHAIRGDVFQEAFQTPLKEWSATIAGHIGSDVTRASGVAKTHRIGIIMTTDAGRIAFGPDGERIDPEELLKDASRFRQIDVHIQHGHEKRNLAYSFMLDNDQVDDQRSPLLAVLVVLLLITFGLAYAIQLRLLRPLKWLRSGVDAVSTGDISIKVPVVRNDEIGKVARAFNQMTDRVQQMMDDRERLLADVSHELRSPLARIKVALELLPEGDKRNSIAQDIREMESLTTALLEREQVRARVGNQDRSESINLIALVGEIVDEFKDTAPGVELNVPPHNIELDGEAALIRVLIHNLVDNAVKFSLPDSGPVEISLQQSAEETRIIVKDDGPGIPKNKVDDIFEPFVKLNPARGHRSGYGLGLNLCQRIVQAKGGAIQIKSSGGRGTQVSVSFPNLKPV